MLFKRAAWMASLGLASTLLSVGCDSCDSSLQTGGDTPFVRCGARKPDAVPAKIGSVQLSADERLLTITGLANDKEPRVAVFQGPGMPTSADSSVMMAALTESKPDLLLVMGGVSDAPDATKLLQTLAALKLPVLVLPGGRDQPDALGATLGVLTPDARPFVVDLTGFAALDLGAYRLLLVPGAEAGRQAISDQSCGFQASDLNPVETLAKAAPDRRRVLVSWEIPAGGLGRSELGDTGSSLLAGLKADTETGAGIYAWPDVAVTRPFSKALGALAWNAEAADLEISVPRLIGPAHIRDDGTRQPAGFVVIKLGSAAIVSETPR